MAYDAFACEQTNRAVLFQQRIEGDEDAWFLNGGSLLYLHDISVFQSCDKIAGGIDKTGRLLAYSILPNLAHIGRDALLCRGLFVFLAC